MANVFTNLIESTKAGFQGNHWKAYEDLKRSGEIVYTRKPSMDSTGVLPYLVVCTGYTGSGKTTLGSRLKEAYGFRLIDSDYIRDEVLGGLRGSPEQEAKVTKAMVELRDHYLSLGYSPVITGCNVSNRYRQEFLSTNRQTSGKMLLHFRPDRKLTRERRGESALDFMDSIWEEPDLKLPFMKGVKYLQVSPSVKREDVDKIAGRVFEELVEF